MVFNAFLINVRGGGTTTSVWPAGGITVRPKPDEAHIRSLAARAIIVSVFPKPIESAIIPPWKLSGSSRWWVPDIRFTKLLWRYLVNVRFLFFETITTHPSPTRFSTYSQTSGRSPLSDHPSSLLRINVKACLWCLLVTAVRNCLDQCVKMRLTSPCQSCSNCLGLVCLRKVLSRRYGIENLRGCQTCGEFE